MAKEKTKEELQREIKLKSAGYERKLNNKNNKFIIISLILILLGYGFFLFSPKLFHEKPERFYTEIGSAVNFTGGSITPSSWVYAESPNMMQVEFTYKSNQVLAPGIEVNAATSYDDRTKPSSKLKAEIIYQENDFYIANIYNIPEDYYCVSLRIKTVEDKTSESVRKISNNDGIGNEVVKKISETEDSTGQGVKEVTSTAVIYTCRDAVDTVSTLYPLEDYIYKIKRIQSNINLDYTTINENNSAIDSLKSDNAELEYRNNELTNQMLYMTSSEKQLKEREIESNKSKINDNISKISSFESTNLTLQSEIREYCEIIKRIAAENEGRDYTAPTQDVTEQPTELFSHTPAFQSSATESSSVSSEKSTQPSPTQITTKQQSNN